MSRADGSVIIDTKMDTEGVKHGTEEIKKELGEVGESSTKANDSIGGDLVGGFKKLGKAIAAAKVVEKLYEFGKEAVDLGSDLEEVQNVVDVTFTTMSDKVNKFAKDAQKSAGLSETMAKQYVGTFGAMADSFGFTEEEAYNMSTALTQLSGDVASFYNLSQDEAMNKLKGVFTGETEALKELGVVMTQAALDNYALANGYEKTTAAMTEQEKVALRYQFVMDQLSASSGDFVRTQDSWANQSKVLSLQWESLMATLGTGMIDVLSPGMEFLNDKVLPGLNDFADKFAEAMDPTPSEKLRKSLNSFEDTVTSANKELDKTTSTVEANARLAERYKNRLNELEEAGLDNAAAQTEYATIVGYLNEIYPELNLNIDAQTGALDANSRAQLQNLDAMKQRALVAAQEARYTAMLQSWADASTAVVTAEADLIQVQEQKAAITDELTEKTGLSIEQLVEMYQMEQMQTAAFASGNDTMGSTVSLLSTLKGAMSSLTAEDKKLIKQILNLKSEEDALNDTIAEGKKTVSSYDAELETLGDTFGETKSAAGEFANQQTAVQTGMSEAANAISQTTDELQKIRNEYNEAKEAALSSIEAQIGAFDELVVKSDKSAAEIIKNWESQQAAFSNYSENLKKAVDMGLDEALVKQLSDGSKESMAILNEFVNSTDASVDEINAAFRKTKESKEAVATTMADIQSDIANKMSSIYQSISTTWGDAEAVVKRAMKQMQSDIDGLKGKTVTVQILTNGKNSGGYSGQDMSLSNPSLGGYSLRTPEVPYLASGAVIPPNAPFLAMLGDQKHGTNIEAPLSTIQQAVALEMEDVVNCLMSGFSAVVSETEKLRHTVQGLNISDDFIGEANERYETKMSVVRGW